MNCEKCGQPLHPDSSCKPSPIMKALSGELGFTGHRLGTVVEGPPDSPEGRRVESNPSSGGLAYSRTDRTGAFVAELSEPLDRGRQSERQAIEVLIQALRIKGDEVQLIPGSQDSCGEDGRISMNGSIIPVQVVSIPVDDSFWMELAKQGSILKVGDGVDLVRKGFLHKKDKAIGTFLILDAAQVGAIVGPALVENYCRMYGNPEDEFSLHQAWIVGPTVRSTIRLRPN